MVGTSKIGRFERVDDRPECLKCDCESSGDACWASSTCGRNDECGKIRHNTRDENAACHRVKAVKNWFAS